MKEIKSVLKKKDDFWQSFEKQKRTMTDEELMKNKKEEFEYQYQNCVIISLARFLKYNQYPEITKLTNNELLAFAKQTFTDETETKKENHTGFITTTKNISTLLSTRKLIINTELCKEDIEYMMQFENALIMQKYKDSEAHAVFIENIKKELLENRELSADFTSMMVLLN
jgi:hypothetical protein